MDEDDVKEMATMALGKVSLTVQRIIDSNHTEAVKHRLQLLIDWCDGTNLLMDEKPV